MFYLFFMGIIFIVLLFWWNFNNSLKLPPRYEDQWPVVGCAHKLLGMDSKGLLELSDVVGESCIRNGGVLQLNLGPSLVFAITDPDDCITILNTCLEKYWAYEFVKPWLGDGLVSVTHNLGIWKRHRKIIYKSFSPYILEGYIGIFNTEIRHLVGKLADQAGRGYFDHSSVMKDVAFEIMFRTTLGFSDENIDKDTAQKCKEGIKTMLNVIAARFQCIWMNSDLIYRFTSLKKKQDETIALLHKASDEIINRKRLALRSTKGEGDKFKSFLDMLLQLPPHEAFTDKEIKEELDTMIVAGFDTTSTILTYALILLGSHQDVQEKVLTEIREVFGNSFRDVEKQDIPRLVYMEAMLMETMRLYPILPVTMRYNAKDINIKNYTLPAGSSNLVMIRVMHRDPGVWGPDAAEFIPERWLPTPPPAALAFAGFSIGKRGCIGKTYALMSMKTVLVHLLRHYRVIGDVTKLELQLDTFLKPAAGCEIALERRQ